jgi:hypothetical protein
VGDLVERAEKTVLAAVLHYGDIHTSNRTVVDVEADFGNIPKLDVTLKHVSTGALLDDGDVVFVDASEDDEGTSKHVVIVNKHARPFISGLHTIVAKATREALRYLCEPVPAPREVEQYLHSFCGDLSSPTALTDSEPLRISFYKAVANFLRAYANLAQNLSEAGYTDAEAAAVVRETEFFADLRAAIKRHSGEELDIKPYEADMRHLINTYIQADPADTLGNLSELSLTELIIQTGIHDAIARKLNAKGQLSKNSVAEAIVNNVRKTIIRDQLTDPRFYAEMSQLLDDLILQKRAGTVSYEEFLQRAEALARRLGGKAPSESSGSVNSAKLALAVSVVRFSGYSRCTIP